MISEHVNIISFADYNMFELNGDDYENRVSSTYISSLIQKVVDDSQNNPFYQAYLKDKELGIERHLLFITMKCYQIRKFKMLF